MYKFTFFDLSALSGFIDFQFFKYVKYFAWQLIKIEQFSKFPLKKQLRTKQTNMQIFTLNFAWVGVKQGKR